MAASRCYSSCDVALIKHRQALDHLSCFLVVMFMMSTSSQAGFLFPDMAVQGSPLMRSGSHFKYRIYALQQEPYLSANGTGYLPELMASLSETYSRLKKGVITFNYEVRPVKTWKELINKATFQQEKLAFGLVSPPVLRSDATYKDMHSSMATVHTSIKLITHRSTMNHHPNIVDRGHALHHATKGSNFVMLRDSPEDRLLVVRPKFRSTYREVDVIEDGLRHISRHPDSYLVTDSTIADKIVNNMSADGNLTSICTSRKILNSSHLFYGFFGRNSNLLKFINDLLKTMNDDGTLNALAAKHFTGLKQCV